MPDAPSPTPQELPEEIEKAIDALEDAAQEHGWEAGSGSAERTADAANGRRAARSALTAAILSRLGEVSRERRDEVGFVCEYDGSMPDDDYTVTWDKGARWVMLTRSGKITIGQSPCEDRLCVTSTWADLFASAERLRTAEAARDAALARVERLEKLHRLFADAQPTVARHGDEIVLYCPDGTITDDLYEAIEAASFPSRPALKETTEGAEP